jgi:hypothetical protein
MEPPRYSWNIVESGAKHHNPSPTPEWNFLEVLFQVKYDKDKGYLFVWRYPRYKLVLRNKDIYQQICSGSSKLFFISAINILYDDESYFQIKAPV